MSYRSFKHLLGETSLERKCRFIFGLGILLLVTVSFFLYGKKTEELVRNQATQNARLHVNDALKAHHLIKPLNNIEFSRYLTHLWDEFKPQDDVPTYKARVLSPSDLNSPDKQLTDAFERTQIARFVKDAASRSMPCAR